MAVSMIYGIQQNYLSNGVLCVVLESVISVLQNIFPR